MMDKSSTSTLTEQDIINGMRLFKEAGEAQEKEREERRLKDWSKMSPFYEALNKSDMPFIEKIEFRRVIDMLAEGYFLVMGGREYNMSVNELRNVWQVPQEVIDNIYESKPAQFVSSSSDATDKHWYKKFGNKYA